MVVCVIDKVTGMVRVRVNVRFWVIGRVNLSGALKQGIKSLKANLSLLQINTAKVFSVLH